MIRVLVVLLLLLPVYAQGAHLHKEKEYQEAWCQQAGGETEVVLEDGCRVDCLTSEYAVEFDFGSKWAESVGQSLYYAEMTGKRPGVVLILEEAKDGRYLARLKRIATKLGIRVWTVAPVEISAKMVEVPKR